VIDKIFDAFFTSKIEGMGIGLNLCRSIVESHDGRMHCENLYNGEDLVGCQFSFWLPVMSALSSPNTQETPSVPGV
jgi:signal transduction histidine kinase